MAGKKCPKCSELRFFETPYGGQCTNCGFKMTIPPNSGKGGQGKRCLNCGENRVFGDVCRSCGARYSS